MSRKTALLKYSSCAAALMMAAGLVNPASAQNAESSVEAEQGDPEDSGVIIVTAQKRAQNILDVPISVATVSEEKLSSILDAGADIRGLSARVPSLYVEGSSGRTAPRFYVRGLGNVDFDLSASQPVSIISDEVVLENVLLKGFPIFDIAQTEILRGPQGTLFGRNTPAGIVKFDTAKPTQSFEGYVSGSYGRFDSVKLNAALSGPLSDSLSARVAGEYTRRSDFVENVNPGADFAGNNDGEPDLGGFSSVALRSHLLFEPDTALDFSSLLTFQYQRLRGTTTLFRANILSPGSNELNDNFDRFEVAFDGGRNNESNTEIFGATWRNELDTGSVTLTSVTGYYVGDSDGVGDIDGGVGTGATSFPGFIPFRSETGSLDTDVEQFTQEFRVSNSGNDRFNWQIGAFYFWDEFTADSASFNGTGDPNPTILAITTQQSEAYAFFGQLSYDLTDALTVTGGVRYSDERKVFRGTRPLGFLGPINAETRTQDDSINWDLALNYEISEGVTLFSRVATGFRGPSIQGRLVFSNNVTVANSEDVISFDAGVKASLLDNALRINLAGFYYEVDDQQFTAIGGLGNFNQLINADKGVGQGFELDIDFSPVDNLDLSLGYSFNDTEIQDDDLLVAFCGGGCTVTDPLVTVGTTTRASIDGNPFPQAPRTILTATGRYAIPVGGGEIYLFGDYSRLGRTNFFLYESEEFQVNGNFEVGLRAGYIDFDNGFEIAAFVRNLTNEENLIGGIDFNNLTGFVNDPRIWGVEAEFKF